MTIQHRCFLAADPSLWRVPFAFGPAPMAKAFSAAAARRHGDQRGQPDRRRDGQDADGVVDRGAAARGKEERGHSDPRLSAARLRASRDSASTSDEAQLLVEAAGRPRCVSAWARIALRKGRNSRSSGVQWFVLDDGFQHRSWRAMWILF